MKDPAQTLAKRVADFCEEELRKLVDNAVAEKKDLVCLPTFQYKYTERSEGGSLFLDIEAVPGPPYRVFVVAELERVK